MSDEQTNGKGKGGGGSRCTEAEMEERIALTADLLALHYHKTQIRATIIARYGISGSTAEKYLARARAKLRALLDGDIEEHRSKSLTVYAKVVRDPQATPREKVLAQQRIDKILGLESAHKVEHSGNLSLGDFLSQADDDEAEADE